MPDTKRNEPARRVRQPDKASLLKRLNRIEGQVRGIARMVDEDRYCVEVLTQVSLLRDHTQGCVRAAVQSGRGDASIEELLAVVEKFTR
jgi:CsoR family transcriptional regulator, copper-sensing transcriptional repressor